MTSLAGRLHFSANSLTVTPSDNITMPISSWIYSSAIQLAMFNEGMEDPDAIFKAKQWLGEGTVVY